jgi:hypothetical protein
MHQNKFHTERIQELTLKLQNAAKGGPPLTEEERKVADHLKILYKYSNKGIKGRGKKMAKNAVTGTTAAVPTVEPTTATRIETAPIEQPSFTGGGGQALLPLPITKPVSLRGIEGPSRFMVMAGGPPAPAPLSWHRDVFIGNQGPEGPQVGGGQPNYLGDAAPGTSMNTFSFGNMG